MFTKSGGHHRKEEFQIRGKEPAQDELQIYTWLGVVLRCFEKYFRKDATLRELADLVKEVRVEARRRDAKISFAFVYPDKLGHSVIKEVCIALHIYFTRPCLSHYLHLQSAQNVTFMQVGCSYVSSRTEDDEKTLDELHFEVGDFLDVALTTAEPIEPRQSAQGPPSEARFSERERPRDRDRDRTLIDRRERGPVGDYPQRAEYRERAPRADNRDRAWENTRVDRYKEGGEFRERERDDNTRYGR